MRIILAYMVLLAGTILFSYDCLNAISGAKEKKINTSMKTVLYCRIGGNVLGGASLGYMIYFALLRNDLLSRTLFCIYLGINILVNIYFWNKKTGGSVCVGACRFLKYAWIVLVFIYTLLLTYCLYETSVEIVVFAVVVYVLYNSCILGFDYIYQEEVKEWDSDRNGLLPLRQLSVEQYRIWERKRQRNAGRRLLIIIVAYQAVLAVLLLATAKHITLAAILILAFLCALTLGIIAFACSKRLKEIEGMQIESVCRGRGMVETMSPFRVRYMDSEGAYQSRVVEKKQRRKEKQGTIVDIIVENGEIVLAEKKLPE